jgi:maltooligosyltrehalose trehalohydrolase
VRIHVPFLFVKGFVDDRGKKTIRERTTMKIGTCLTEKGTCSFTVWAPFVRDLSVRVGEESFPMNRGDKGYWRAECAGVGPGALYKYCLGSGIERPDPASRFQPEGVHGPSQVVDQNFAWGDQGWVAPPLNDMVIYEIHTGAFTSEGTFRSAAGRLGDLKSLGINTLEIMPVAQFPGNRSWGYDGTYPFAVQNSYGGPAELKAFVDACHRNAIAVILDVVYNHLGPEGNYLADFGPYFTDRYKTPWGQAINFDGPYSNDVREFFFQNALFWLDEFHVDGLRLDAVHGIFDFGAVHFLKELADRVSCLAETRGRKAYLIAESDLNDVRVITRPNRGGYGIDAQWSDDFHHSLHTLLTGENQGYYVDYGGIEDMVTVLFDGFVYEGEYSVYRKRNHGNSARDLSPGRFVFFCQNHDQVGNRMKGERLAALVPFDALKLAAGVLLTSPYVPLLFMGEEYGEENPFLYFADHSDIGLVKAVREGRKEEFEAFGWKEEPPAPEDLDTFLACKLQWEKRRAGRGKTLTDCFRRLIELRYEIRKRTDAGKEHTRVYGAAADRLLVCHRWNETGAVFSLCNLGESTKIVTLPLPEGRWAKAFDAEDEAWGGRGGSMPARIEGENGGLTLGGYGFVVFFAEA